jgi:hypothetical protein
LLLGGLNKSVRNPPNPRKSASHFFGFSAQLLVAAYFETIKKRSSVVSRIAPSKINDPMI